MKVAPGARSTVSSPPGRGRGEGTAIAFVAAAEARAVDAGARVVPIREEQLHERLGERFRELDVPLLVEWPDGRRAALLFVLEEETDPARFSIHRLAHYCLELAELFATERIVAVVIFLRPGGHPASLRLGGDAHSYLEFRYLACALAQIPARDHLVSDNLVARLNLPNMAYPPEDKVEVYAQAVRGLLESEPHPEKRVKYLDFIDIYANLDDNQRQDYATCYPREAAEMSGFAERFIEQGKQKGIQQGLEQERLLLSRQARKRVGAEVADRSAPLLNRIESTGTLADLAEALLDAAGGEAWLAALRQAVD